jgi:hypothetical protein
MTCLIVTTEDTGAGCLKQARLADKVVCIDHKLVCGPVPAISDPAAFFAERAELFHAEGESWAEWEDGKEWSRASTSTSHRKWLELTAMCEEFERVELWIDPGPNAQLLLVQLLAWFHPHTDTIEKLVLVHADAPIGGQTPEEIVAWTPCRQKVEIRHLKTAELAWEAFRQPTPEAWFVLLGKDIGALPYLRRSVSRLLEELPAVGTALGATQTRILEVVSRGDAAPFRVLANCRRDDDLPVLSYWERGQTLDRLARCPAPAVLGLDEGPFTLAMHDDCRRYERYKRSTLSLSELGQALVENREDFSRHNRIHRWWGGTKLTNERLWRWDAANNALISPR